MIDPSSTSTEFTNLSPSCRNKPPFGRSEANIFAWLTWHWIYDIIRIGYKRELIIDDIDNIDNDDKSEILLNKFLKGWNYQLKKNPNNPTLY